MIIGILVTVVLFVYILSFAIVKMSAKADREEEVRRHGRDYYDH